MPTDKLENFSLPKDFSPSENTKALEPFTYGEILNAQMNVVKLLTFKY